MADNLPACLHCGSEADLKFMHETGGYWVQCFGCSIQTQYYYDPDDAIAAWSRRAAPSPQGSWQPVTLGPSDGLHIPGESRYVGINVLQDGQILEFQIGGNHDFVTLPADLRLCRWQPGKPESEGAG